MSPEQRHQLRRAKHALMGVADVERRLAIERDRLRREIAELMTTASIPGNADDARQLQELRAQFKELYGSWSAAYRRTMALRGEIRAAERSAGQ